MGNRGTLDWILHINSSYSSELDVRLLNHPNRTYTTQVMVHFLGLPQFGLFICYVRILGLISVLILWTIFVASWWLEPRLVHGYFGTNLALFYVFL